MPAPRSKWLKSLMAVCISAILTIGPVAFIQGDFSKAFSQWQEIGFYLISIIGGGISVLLGFDLAPGEKELTQQRKIVWGAVVFMFLYVAASALCERLNVGMLEANFWRNAGITFVSVGSAIRLWAIAVLGTFHSVYVAKQPGHFVITKGPYHLIRHPSYLGLLIDLFGIPMVFGAWLPLLAMPGVFVLINWRIIDEEAFLIQEFGDEYQSYTKHTWRLIPKVY